MRVNPHTAGAHSQVGEKAAGPCLVAGYDDSPPSRAAFRFACERAGADGQVIVIHVALPPTDQAAAPALDRLLDERRREAERLLVWWRSPTPGSARPIRDLHTLRPLLVQGSRSVVHGGDHVELDAARQGEQVGDAFVSEGVHHVRAFAASDYETDATQDAKLLREVWLLHLDVVEKVGDGAVAIVQQLEDSDAQRMAERLEELRVQARGVSDQRHVMMRSAVCAWRWR